MNLIKSRIGSHTRGDPAFIECGGIETMKKFSPGFQFLMCSRDELVEKGWEEEDEQYFHDDFSGNCISEDMLDFEGRVLTVANEMAIDNWYLIEEDDSYWSWPVATFMPASDVLLVTPSGHACEEGMTELGGWFICKHCGTNLRKIK